MEPKLQAQFRRFSSTEITRRRSRSIRILQASWVITEPLAPPGVVPAEFCRVDLACGKVRPLIAAAELGFMDVVGIEFSPSLVATAKANLDKLHVSKPSVICRDTSANQFPDGDFVLFLSKPFPAVVMHGVIQNLRMSQARHVIVVYHVPVWADLVDGCGFLTRLGSPPGRSREEALQRMALAGDRQRVSANRAWDELGDVVIVWKRNSQADGESSTSGGMRCNCTMTS